MFFYSIRNYFVSRPVWCYYTNNDLILSAVNYINDNYIFQTYPLKNITIIHNLCSINNLTYNVYNAKTIIIKK